MTTIKKLCGTLVTAGLLVGAGAGGAADQYEKYRGILAPLPALPPIPADNPMTPEKIELGKMIFWDRRVSKTGGHQLRLLPPSRVLRRRAHA